MDEPLNLGDAVYKKILTSFPIKMQLRVLISYLFILPCIFGFFVDKWDDMDKELKAGTSKIHRMMVLSAFLSVTSLIELIMEVRSTAKNRPSFVKDALFKSMYLGKGNCSVLVFNLKQKHKWHDEPAIRDTIYTSTTYGGNIYAVWIFRHTAKFENLGPQTPENWAYYGRIKREGGNITFYSI